MKFYKEFQPFDGENILTVIEGNAWNDNPNPFFRIIIFTLKVLAFFLGIKKNTVLIVTDKRISQIEKSTIFWIIPLAVGVYTLNKSSIQFLGWEMATSYLFFRKYYFVIANQSVRVKITVKGGGNKLMEDCKILDRIVTKTI